jgi:hypothetical protein
VVPPSPLVDVPGAAAAELVPAVVPDGDVGPPESPLQPATAMVLNIRVANAKG